MGVAFYLANQTTQRSYQSAQKISKRQSKTSKLEEINSEIKKAFSHLSLKQIIFQSYSQQL